MAVVALGVLAAAPAALAGGAVRLSAAPHTSHPFRHALRCEPHLPDGRRPLAGCRAAYVCRPMSTSGAWTRWVALSEEAPVWTGPARRVRLRRRGDVRHLRVTYITTPRVGAPAAGTVIPAVAVRPGIVTRAGWHADESIRRAAPTYAPELKMVFVHHTDTATSAPCSDSARIVRGIYAYHVRTNGWNDIGYNFLVDKCGTVFEGRYGGMSKPVIGAQTKGFNTGSAGIAVIGTYSSARPRPVAVAALERLIAWRLDVAHVDPGLAGRDGVVGEPALPGRAARRHERGLRTPGRLPDVVPRFGALCALAAHPGGGAKHRPAEDLVTDAHAEPAPDRARRRAAPRAAGQVLQANGVHAHDPGPGRPGRRAPTAHERAHSLDVGRPGRGAPGRALPMDDRGLGGPRVRGHARRAAAVGAARAAGLILGVEGDGDQGRACEPGAPRWLDARHRLVRGRPADGACDRLRPADDAAGRPCRHPRRGQRRHDGGRARRHRALGLRLELVGRHRLVHGRRPGRACKVAAPRRRPRRSQAGTARRRRPGCACATRSRGRRCGRLRPRTPQTADVDRDDLVGGVRDAGHDQPAGPVDTRRRCPRLRRRGSPDGRAGRRARGPRSRRARTPGSRPRSPRGHPPGGRPGRSAPPFRSRSEVGATRASAGRSPASWFAFTPMPTTTSPSRTSARMPASFRPSTTTSFGHRTRRLRPRRAGHGLGDHERQRRQPLRRGLGVKRQREEQARSARALPLPAPAAPPGGLLLAGRDAALRQAAGQLLSGRARLLPHIRPAERAPQEGPHDLGTQRALPHATRISAACSRNPNGRRRV